MAKKDKQNLADMSVDDLKQALADERAHLKKMKFKSLKKSILKTSMVYTVSIIPKRVMN